MKRFTALLLITVLLFSLTGCNTQPVINENGNAESPAGNSRPELPLVRAIVFDSTVDTPSMAYSGEGMQIEANMTLKLTLFETAPDVFVGEGIFDAPSKMQMLTTTTTTQSRTRLTFQSVVPGEAGGHTELSNIEYASRETSVGLPFDYSLHIALPTVFKYKLTVDGDAALMSVTLGNEELIFEGICTQLPPKKPTPRLDALDGRCIAVNSTFMESGKSHNHEYRAMLTAERTNGYEFAGELCVYGSGKAVTFADEAVRFTMQHFDEKAYREAGGALPGSFDAFGVINAAGKYIVLLDGDTPLIEAVNSEAAFFGTLLPADQAGEAKRVAGESKQLMKTLYDGCGAAKFAEGSPIIYEMPAWYPHWLIPKPIKGANDWGWGTLLRWARKPIWTRPQDFSIFNFS